MRSIVLPCLSVAAIAACSGGAGTPDATLATDSAGSIDASAGSDAVLTDAAPECAAAQAALANEIYGNGAAWCTAVVRFDFQSLAPKGFVLDCGATGGPITEASTRAAVATISDVDDGTLLGGTNDAPYAYWESAGDFGGFAVTSALTGEALVAGTTVFDGAGDLTFPSTWRSAIEHANGCTPIQPRDGIGFDLRNGSALDPTELARANSAINSTAIPAAMWQGGYEFGRTTYLYPRSVGAFNPATAEFIVVYWGGWLE